MSSGFRENKGLWGGGGGGTGGAGGCLNPVSEQNLP